MTPLSGSLVGGTTVTISGAGLTNDVSVLLGDSSCNSVSASSDGSSLTCVTSSGGAQHVINNMGKHASKF